MTTQDPIQGLIDFVEEIKPFHTKILEVAVAYAQSDDVDITFTEDFDMEVSMFWPALADEDDVPIQNCPEGWGEVWDRQSPYIVVDAGLSPQTISLDGDQSAFFQDGTRFEIRESTIDDGSPTTQNTPRVAEMLTLSTSYDTDSNTTIIGVAQTSFDFLGSPIILFGSPPTPGSPLTPEFGSPLFSGTEFFFPPYPSGSVSSGDVFVIYNVVETNELVIFTRPTPFYGSPIPGPGSPNVGFSRWRHLYYVGSPQVLGGSPPLPGSPKIVTGSPATYPDWGSPKTNYNTQPTPGNTIIIKAISTAPFIYGREVEIRNASEPSLNKTYNILSATDLGGSPELIELTLLNPVLADSTNDGELVFTPNGWSGGDLCSDIPPELTQTHWMEDLQQTWRFAESPLEENFQHFILEADSTNNTYVVEGDVRYLLTFGSPIEFAGSPIGLNVSVAHAVSPPYIPFGSPAGFTVVLSDNNGNDIVRSISYDVNTNRSTLTMDSVSVDTPTGWITFNVVPPIMVILPTANNIVFDSVFTPTVFTQTRGLVFNDEGTEMYIGAGSLYIRHFTLSTAWDITSATENAGITLGGTNVGTAALTWGDGGMKLYGGDAAADTIAEWNLDAPYDVGSAAGRSPVNSQSQFEPMDMSFNFDGTKLYISSNDASARVSIWDLATAWDISVKTITFNEMVAPLDSSALGLVVAGDGKRLWQAPLNQLFIYNWEMSTPNDLSTLSYTTDDDGIMTDASTFPYVMYVPVGRKELYVGWSTARSIQKYTWA